MRRAASQDFGQIARARQIAKRKIRAEQLHKFARLVLVTRGQEQIHRAQVHRHPERSRGIPLRKL